MCTCARSRKWRRKKGERKKNARVVESVGDVEGKGLALRGGDLSLETAVGGGSL
jgi:hypothetical protein